MVFTTTSENILLTKSLWMTMLIKLLTVLKVRQCSIQVHGRAVQTAIKMLHVT